MARPPIRDADDTAAAVHRIRTFPTVDGGDVAVAMGVHQQTLINAADAGTLPIESMRIGRRWVFPTAPLREFLGLTTEAEPLATA